MAWILIGAAGLTIWLGLLLAPWRPWSTRERLESHGPTPDADLSDITALIPARDEAAVIAPCLRALRAQGLGIKILVVDDNSEDHTADHARSACGGPLHVLAGRPLPPGWAGKLWALQQGSTEVTTPLLLLLDADIELAPGILATMRGQLGQENLGLLSLMATLPMERFWEKLLIPAFVYFFKLLYPFHLANATGSRFAAAAGGCILLETRILQDIGGFESFKNALIDDCALASRVKQSGARTFIGLSRAVRSMRGYPDLCSIWAMVARSAFTQLRYSFGLLTACTVLLVTAFWSPVVTMLSGVAAAQVTAALALVAMCMSFIPILRYYERSPAWALALPLIGTLYLGMTWSSAVRYWRGTRSVWKNRIYSVDQSREVR